MPRKIPDLGGGEILTSIMEVLSGKGGERKYGLDVFMNHLWPLGSFSLVKTCVDLATEKGISHLWKEMKLTGDKINVCPREF